MAVITRFIVVRNGVELDKVFEVKKEADAYDKMLDAAENLATFIQQSDLKNALDAKTIDQISIHLAQNAPEVNKILKGIKPFIPVKQSPRKVEKAANPAPVQEKKKPGRKPKAKPKAKSKT